MLRRFINFIVILSLLPLFFQVDAVYGQAGRIGAEPFPVGVSIANESGAFFEDQKADDAKAIERTRRLVEEIMAASYPELKGANIEVKSFSHEADYFRTAFSFSRFILCRRMRFIIKVNPKVFELQAPEEGVRAIIAHEIGHVFYFKKRNRIRLLGLVRLASKDYTAKFERWTDLHAISRGYADGLKAYREWLYKNVPAKKLEEKKRSYFSPEEIDALKLGIQRRPELLDHWFKHVPRNLEEIEKRSEARK